MIPTTQLTLSPEFHDAVRAIAPKRRRSKLLYVLGIAVVAVVVLGVRRSTRELIMDRLHLHLAAKPADAPPATATAPAQAEAPVVAPPAVPVPPDTVAAAPPQTATAAAPVVKRAAVPVPKKMRHRHPSSQGAP